MDGELNECSQTSKGYIVASIPTSCLFVYDAFQKSPRSIMRVCVYVHV